MIYKVHEGCTVRWPDGSVRASEGEVFDGFNTSGTQRSIEFASVILASHRDHIYPSDGPVTSSAPMSGPIALAFADLAGSMQEVATANAKKGASKKKKKKATKTRESLADPDDGC